MLELIGVPVVEAVAFFDGGLVLSFDNAMTLQTASTTGYEAWHFQFPKPGRPPAGDVTQHLSLHGAAGRLV